ncbi:hypothetical protein L593_00015 [Salinarchaeum sp. Harcht-Bsk1]|uniref:LolA family protein n=1 Tax=Salinarchaeum sp. Harcht-Bsk1 TaxID=1333523 RepID=UPI00034229F6|nr:hypothetical protein [Salinarchaeum sp. Harcht-Bsk1]AGM99957.1 hypothetical protein L593_00015 [Salinarchaeum sp. Harcht-Bsk1]
MSTARRIVLALVLLGVLGLAGCALQFSEDSYPDESEVRDTLDSLETIEADVVTEQRSGGNATAISMHVVQNFDTGEFRVTVQSGPNRGTTMVSNGSRMWYYQPEQNVVRVIAVPDASGNVNRTVEMVAGMYDQLEDGDADGSVGISAAPTVPAAGTSAGSAQDLSIPLGENLSVESSGTEAVDGREARVIHLDAPADSGLVQNATYWIDREWHFPIRSRIGVQVGNDTTVATSTYRNVSYNPSFDGEQFTFDPPATARVVEGVNGTVGQYERYSALASATDRDVPEPSVPDDYEFETGQIQPAGDGQSITLIYSDGSDSFTVTKLAGVDSDLENGERIDVGSKPGRRVSVGANEAVVWTCGGNTYSVVGAGDTVSLHDVATSIGCQ